MNVVLVPKFQARNLFLLCLFALVNAGSAIGCKHATATGEDASAPPVHVETAAAIDVDAPITLQLTGSLKGMKEADLAANATGRVTRTFVDPGSEVKAGAIIAQLDTSAAALSLNEAQVQVDTSQTQEAIAKADCARYEQLKAKGAISPLEYDQATAKCKTSPLDLQVAQARQSIAAKNVGDGTIRAPFAGVVSERYVEVGEYVQPSSKVASIVQGGDLKLQFTVAEANVAAVKIGADVSFVVAAYPDKTFHGTVRFISGAVREATRDLVAEAVVPNDDGLLKPGMFANVSLVTGTHKLPAIPLSAVFERQQSKRAYVVVANQLQERVLQPGPIVDGKLSIADGLATGELVVIANVAALHNGQSVQ